MNKMNMLALTGLMFFGANSTFAMGKQEREILYTLHELGQNIADVPMITENIDMFMGITAMNIQLTEVRLAAANKSFKKTLWKNAAVLGGILLAQNFSLVGLNNLRDGYLASYNDNMFDLFHPIRLALIDGFIINDLLGLVTVGKVFAALNIHDAWKNRSALIEALALDKEILGQLQEIKDSMDQDSETAGNFLLKSVE